MKRLNWLIALLSVFSLTLAACGSDDVETPNKPSQEEPTPDEPNDPEKPAVQSFDIKANEITHLSASFTVTPAIEDADYLTVLYDAQSFESVKERYFISNLFQELKAKASSIGMTLSQYLEQYVVNGVSTPSYTDLAAASDYYVIVFGIDLSGECSATTELFKHKFTTAEAPVVEVTFDIKEDVVGTTARIIVTPSNSTIWYYTLMSSAQFAQYLEYGYTAEDIIQGMYTDQLNQYMNSGMSKKEAINNTFHICDEQHPSKIFEISYLTYNTEYTHIIAGFVIDQDANITLASPVYTPTFTTGDIGEVNLTFDITVTDIEPMRAAIKVVPSDLNQYFYWEVGRWDGHSTAEEVMQTIMPWSPYTGIQDYTGGPGSPYKMTLDAPDTDYFVIAFGYAPGAGITTEPTMVTFRSLPAPSAEDTSFILSASGVSLYGFTLKVESSVSSTYYYANVITPESFDEATIIAEVENMYAADYQEWLAVYPDITYPEFFYSMSAYGYVFRGDVSFMATAAPGTTFMGYVCALDSNTGKVVKLHTFENLVTTPDLGEATPVIKSVKVYSGREENGTIFGDAAYTESKAIVAIEYGDLDKARSLFTYMSEGDLMDIEEMPDSTIWHSIADDDWDKVSTKQPYFFYLVSWDTIQTVLAYAVDDYGRPGLMARQYVEVVFDQRSNIEELRELVNTLNAQSSQTSRLAVAKSIVVAE